MPAHHLILGGARSGKSRHAQAAAEALARMELDQLRRDAAQAAGIPQLWQRLQGETADELAADAAVLAAFAAPAQPANGQRTAATPPTPAAQGTRGITEEERRQKAVRTF